LLRPLLAIEKPLYLALHKGMRYSEANFDWIKEAIHTVAALKYVDRMQQQYWFTATA